MKQFRNIAKFALAAVFAAGAFVHVDAKGVAQGSAQGIEQSPYIIEVTCIG